jgi:predicted ATP-grasp superfamily ATP-dependent carboligase
MQCPKTILILGNHRNALSVARQLGEQHRIILGGKKGDGRIDRSRFVAESWPLPDPGSELFAAELVSLLDNLPDDPILFPIGDIELAAVARMPGIQDGSIKAVMPAAEITTACLDKAANLDLANDLRVPQAPYQKVKQLSDLARAVEEVGCPCIIKSDHQLSLAFGKKAYPINDPDDLAALIARESEPEHGLIVQARATGLRHNVYFAADKGRLVGAMQARVVRTTNFDGSGFTVESESVPLNDELLQPTQRLVEALKYHGIGNTQFLVDPESGSLSFLEISPRMGAAYAVTIPCGFNFADAGLSLADGTPVESEHLPSDYPSSKRLAWSYGDFVGLVKAAGNREVNLAQACNWLYSAARAGLTADIHTTWSWRDPQPTLAIAYTALAKILRSN